MFTNTQPLPFHPLRLSAISEGGHTTFFPFRRCPRRGSSISYGYYILTCFQPDATTTIFIVLFETDHQPSYSFLAIRVSKEISVQSVNYLRIQFLATCVSINTSTPTRFISVRRCKYTDKQTDKLCHVQWSGLQAQSRHSSINDHVINGVTTEASKQVPPDISGLPVFKVLKVYGQYIFSYITRCISFSHYIILSA